LHLCWGEYLLRISNHSSSNSAARFPGHAPFASPGIGKFSGNATVRMSMSNLSITALLSIVRSRHSRMHATSRLQQLLTVTGHKITSSLHVYCNYARITSKFQSPKYTYRTVQEAFYCCSVIRIIRSGYVWESILEV